MIREGVIIGGRYEIMERIGTGGMADVYKASDRVLRRYVAIKVLKREFREDETFVTKFRSEAQSAAGLTHANIVNVYDVAEDRGLHFIVMELVEGITLKEYIEKKGKLMPKEAIAITLQVCAGIAAAHEHNIIHRDIKPQNIMISKDGKVKVTDFGIAKATSSNTISTNVMGSVHYTSPEQARGGFSDTKSDIYSLGITMYEMITGQLPFDGDSTVTIALKHLQEDMIAPSAIVSDIPYSLEQIIFKCTQKSPDRRYLNIAALARDLKHSIQDPDGDFVKIAPLVNGSNTVMITPDELEKLKSASSYDVEYDDYDDYDDYYEERRERRQRGNAGKDIEVKMSKMMKVLTIVAASIFAIFLCGGILWACTNPGILSTEKKGVVPNLVGMEEDDAKEACEIAGVEYEIEKEESLDYEEGYVFKQTPGQKVKLPEGAKVTIYVSTGLKKLEMPDLVEKEEKEAIKELTHIGFKKEKIKVKEINDDEVGAGKVIKTDPEAGSMETSKSSITIWVSIGVGKAIMPDLYGTTPAEAEEMLSDVGLVGEMVLVDSADASEHGKVLEQEVAADEEVERGTTVKYSVGGVAIPELDNLINRPYKEVIEQLKAAGVKVSIQRTASTDYKKDMVEDVKEAGQIVVAGSTVTVFVSDGPGPDSPEDSTGSEQS